MKTRSGSWPLFFHCKTRYWSWSSSRRSFQIWHFTLFSNASACISESSASYSEVVEAEGVGLVLEDVVAESSEDTSQQHRYQDGRHGASGMGVASGGMVGGHLEMEKEKKTNRNFMNKSPENFTRNTRLLHSDTFTHTSISARLTLITMATLLSLWRCDCVHSSPPASPMNSLKKNGVAI